MRLILSTLFAAALVFGGTLFRVMTFGVLSIALLAACSGFPATSGGNVRAGSILQESGPYHVEWSKRIGGPDDERCNDVAVTPEGGYLAVGSKRLQSGRWGTWTLKFNSSGEREWDRSFGGPNGEGATAIAANPDGSFLIAGVAHSSDASAYPGSRGNYDMWALKLGPKGQVEWEHAFGSNIHEFAADVVGTGDGGYLLVGRKDPRRGQGAYVVKLNGRGQIEWERMFDVEAYSSANSVVQTADDGYLFVGQYSDDMWVVKLDAVGQMEWDRKFGKVVVMPDAATSVISTSDKGFLVTGFVTPVFGEGEDTWVIKLDNEGQTEWESIVSLKGAGSNGVGALETSDKGFLVLSGLPNGNYLLVTKLDAAGDQQWALSWSDGVAYPTSITASPDGGYLIAGSNEVAKEGISALESVSGYDCYVNKIVPSTLGRR